MTEQESFDGSVLQDLGDLELLVNKKWADDVPQAFHYDVPAAQREVLQKRLLDNLESFLTQSHNAQAVLQGLKANDDPPLFCGRSFRNGEPTYSCRDCAVDPTCVFCMQCFDKSIHKKHKYKISTSCGGGYCDCGDTDAWKNGASCTEHDKANLASTQNPEDRLPLGMQRRAEVLMDKILRYAYQMLIWSEDSALPPELRSLDTNQSQLDLYYTMLLNDEIHTYDQVIHTLQKAVDKCTKKEALEFATTVDREGRACVFSGPKSKCKTVAGVIETRTRVQTKPLAVRVMHYTVVAHQHFAQRLLKWLETIIEFSDGLRQIFCRVAMTEPRTGLQLSLVEKILLADIVFWKAVRSQFHQLFMTGVFKDLSNKTKFGILFTKHYASIYRDFVRDDHYRSVSATAVTVQIYTVTTIVKVLVERHDLIQIILSTILAESDGWKNDRGTLVFQRQRDTENYTVFKRVQFALYDLKYALGCGLPGIQWNDDLRASFLRGFSAFLEFLHQIQGMDAAKRFTAQHIEFEAEWETAFNIQLKMHDCIALLISWCSTDAKVLLVAYESVLKKLAVVRSVPTTNVTVAGRSTDCYKYEVGGPDNYTSVHLPLHRLLAGLSNHLPDSVTYLTPEFAPTNRQFELFNLMEHPLRIQVLLAQVQADMWKRNGFSILNQLHYYQNVKCRQEMYDRDIQLIQSVASLIDPDCFLIHILNKFAITSVFQRGEASLTTITGLSSRQLTVLLEEFLNLIIVILGERYVVGMGQVTKTSITQREIIHQLAINRMSHSDLDKNMPEDPNSETNLEGTVKEVAEFTRAESGKGMYSLKDECRDQFNPCFYHYDKGEQSKAEEFQRSHRKNNNLDQALPIPMMPQWADKYATISELFTCDVMLHMIHTLLTNMSARRSRLRSEIHFEKALHLITMALHEDKLAYERGNKSLRFVNLAHTYKGLPSERADAESEQLSIFELLNQCSASPHVKHEPLKDLLQYILSYFSAVSNIESKASAVPRVRSTHNLGDDTQTTQMNREKQRRLNKAAKSRVKMLEKMQRLQQKFMKGAAGELFSECSSAESEPTLKSANSMMDISGGGEDDHTVALGVNQTAAHAPQETYVCILCQEVSGTDNQATIVYSALVQKSTVLSRRQTPHPITTPSDGMSSLFVPSDLRMGNFTTTCGHPMHAACWKRYYGTIVAKEQRRIRNLMFGNISPAFDIEKGEFFCPLCESIANTVLPVLPNMSRFKPDGPAPVGEVTLSDWLSVLTQLTSPSSVYNLDETCPLPDLAKLAAEVAVAADTMYANFIELYNYLASANEAIISEETAAMVVKFLLSVYSVKVDKKVSSLGVNALEEPDIATQIWNTTAYTLQVLEQLIRSDNKPLFGHISQRQENCISLLVRFSSVCYKVLPSTVVKTQCQKLLRGLLLPYAEAPVQPSSDEDEMPIHRDESDCITDVDAWHYLVSLCFSMPSLFADKSYSIPVGSVNEQYLLHVLLCIHMTQIMLGYDPMNSSQSSGAAADPDADLLEPSTSAASMMGTATNQDMQRMDVDQSGLVSVFTHIYKCIGVTCVPPSTEELERVLITGSLPFLRCAALLFHSLTDVPEPPALHALCEPMEEYKVISKYLALPSNPTDLFTEEIMHIITHRCTDKRVTRRVVTQSRLPVISIHYPLKVNPLIDLPEDYSDLINSASLYSCPNSMGSEESRTPTLCLICGEMLCSGSFCCSVEQNNSSHRHSTIGAVSAHNQKCGAGNGIYLRVRQCQVVLLSGKNKGCFLPAPYVDDYGETDSSLKRGNPMHLCKTAYKDLHRLWLSHGISEKVARTVVSSSNVHLHVAEWFHL